MSDEYIGEIVRYRFEYKYIIDTHTAALLRERAAAVMQADSHSQDGAYVVNNLYLDDRYDSFYYAKYHGNLLRNKYRLRHYNGDLSYIRLERKHKEGSVSYKETMRISPEQYQKIKSGDMDFILTEDEPLWNKLGVIYRLRGLRPAAIYAYNREAFVFKPGNVRFTFDSPLFSSESDGTADVLPTPLRLRHDTIPRSYGMPPYYPMLLEVKYTGFLPEVIKRLLNGLPLRHTEMSKYCIARERGILPYGKI